MIRQILLPVILLLGVFFNGYVMPRRIRRQVADGVMGVKIGGRFCLLWRCWAIVFLGLAILTIVLTIRRR